MRNHYDNTGLHHIIPLVMTMLCAWAGGALLLLAYDWTTIGQGINPFIGIPFGMLLMAAPIPMFGIWRQMVLDLTARQEIDDVEPLPIIDFGFTSQQEANKH